MRSARPTMESAASTCCRLCALLKPVSSKGSSTFWKAVSTGIRLYIWNTNPTWRARQAVSLRPDMWVISSPATVMLPALGTSSPPSRLRSVVLPEPEGPMKATNSPLSTSRFRPWSTSISSLPRWYFLSRERTCTRLPLLLPSRRTTRNLLRLALDAGALAVFQALFGLDHHLFAFGNACHHVNVLAAGGAHPPPPPREAAPAP